MGRCTIPSATAVAAAVLLLLSGGVASGTPGDASDGGGPAWEETVRTVRSGVVRISSTSCATIRGGSGFLVGPDTVVTAEHVVRDAVTTTVHVGERPLGAEVVGVDPEADIALLRLSRPVEGHRFAWAEEQMPEGSDVAALGHPLGGGFAVTAGTVRAHRTTDAGIARIRTDAPVHKGNSGGALITSEGEVAGVVVSYVHRADAGDQDEGVGIATSHTVARELVETWSEDPVPLPAPECAPATGEVDLIAGAVTDH